MACGNLVPTSQRPMQRPCSPGTFLFHDSDSSLYCFLSGDCGHGKFKLCERPENSCLEKETRGM